MSAKEPAKKKLKTTDEFSDFHVENSHLERLPNEVLLKIVDYLQVRDLLRCGQTCRKIRAVVHDESLWKKVNFFSCSRVPTGLLQLILEHGCEYLNIGDQLFGDLSLNQDSQLKLLNLDLNHYYVDASKIFEPLLNSCNSLEKLQLSHLYINSSLISSICTQNSKTLKVLKLNWGQSRSAYRPYIPLGAIQPIIDQCVELEELTFCKTRLSQGSIDYLVKNITPKVSKLCLCTNMVHNKGIEVLVRRCTNLTELNLFRTGITDLSLFYIIEKQQSTLEKLGLIGTRIDLAMLFELKAMKKLKVLDFNPEIPGNEDEFEQLESFRRQNPNIEIVHLGRALLNQGLSDKISNFRYYEDRQDTNYKQFSN
jgi:hypothetical protein